MAAGGWLMMPVLTGHPAGLLGVDGACVLLGLVLASLLVLWAHAMLRGTWPAQCVLLRGLLLACMLPGLVLAVWWPGLAKGATVAGCMIQGVLLAPAAMWPLLCALRRIPPTLSRTACGLGADAQARLRLLWLPLLGWPLAGVAAGCAIMVTLCAMAAASWP
ncbi:hypothetical protein CT154_15950 [Komagataeibacter xylinus]|uniref:Uncharacterized protein n=2 Tax=Komagataeibacter rhaeticus TaxID=215221 RepID=A0A858JS62_9PROT|nr:hypothetical protein CT154_15950 [Komagataeibacter xylinus]QIP37138.1 hypothetical protein GWK63_14225 [Komagataeibacter rhaeticus]